MLFRSLIFIGLLFCAPFAAAGEPVIQNDHPGAVTPLSPPAPNKNESMSIYRMDTELSVSPRVLYMAQFQTNADQSLAPQAPDKDPGMSNYRLGTGDTISISVYDEKELSVGKIRLSDAGTISMPMLGEIKALGITVSDLESLVVQGLKKYLVNPQVTVSIDQYRDFFVNGQVHKPGNFPFQPGLTVRKAIAIAGGFKDRASKRHVLVIREGDEAHTSIKVDLGTPVMPGDIITVEESFF